VGFSGAGVAGVSVGLTGTASVGVSVAVAAAVGVTEAFLSGVFEPQAVSTNTETANAIIKRIFLNINYPFSYPIVMS